MASRTDSTSRSADRVWQPAAEVFDRPVAMSRLIARYVVTGLMALVAVAVLTAYASRSLGVDEVISDAALVTTAAADLAIEPVLQDGLLTGDPAALAAVDAVVRSELRGRWGFLRVKIWSEDGVIVYSDEPRLIGQQFELEEEELDVLRGGPAAGEVSDLDDPENQYEARAVQLLEVYAGATTTGGTPLLFEGYFQLVDVESRGQTVWRRFAPFALGALVLLELLQVPLAISLASQLRKAQAQREHLLRRAIEATDQERRRIASDLHDGVVQDLAGVAFSLAAVARDNGGTAGSSAAVRDAADRVRDSVRSLRSLLVEIYPPNLYDEGLEPAVSDLLATVEGRGVRTSLLIDAPLGDLPLDAAQLLYRVTQEGLRNVVTHADAAHVTVAFTRTASSTVLEIIDDGRGLDGGTPPEREGHLGLRALAGLAGNMGAALTISSVAGQGTTLRLEVPDRD